jgi:serine/threonine protein kinase/cytochrome c-type biogenesis protein CcmH/NrfG
MNTAAFKPVRYGKYILLEKLAVGGMAQLYKAKITGEEGFEKLVAVKQILPHLAEERELISALIDEAKLAALLNHQNIVQIYDFGSMDNSYYIAMEYLFGKDLRNVMGMAKEKGSPLSMENALYIITRVCAGLDYAHKLKDFQGRPLNIIHRDISPQNIFITYEGEVKIVDFGIAKAATRSTVTQLGMIKGKVRYMSPEQASGEHLDYRSDIFSTGIILYEILTGRKMFSGETMQILANVREAKFDAPEAVLGDINPKLCRILHLALAKEPEQRYQSCGDMLSDLEDCMYDLKMHPTSRVLSQYMKELFRQEMEKDLRVFREVEEIGIAEELEEEVKGNSFEVEGAVPAAPPLGGENPSRPRKKGLWYLIAVMIVCVIVIISFSIMRGKSPKPPGIPGEQTKKNETQQPIPAEVVPGNIQKANRLIEEASKLLDKEPEKASNLLIEAVRSDPKNVQAYLKLGRAYLNLKNFDEARATFQRVTELKPDSPDAYFNLGYVYAVKADYAYAERMYRKAAELSPPYLDEALYNLGITQDKQGKQKECIESLEKALRVNPNNRPAKVYLQKIKVSGGKGK